MTSRRRAIRLLLSAWRERGWTDRENAALLVTNAMSESGGSYSEDLVDAIPRGFLDRNRVSRAHVALELERVLGSLEIDASEVADDPDRLRIVFFASSPTNSVPLRLDEEAREIESRLRASEHRDRIDFVTKWAVRPEDLIEALNRERPQVLHFSGHGLREESWSFRTSSAQRRLWANARWLNSSASSRMRSDLCSSIIVSRRATRVRLRTTWRARSE